jgi:hypothetical protein
LAGLSKKLPGEKAFELILRDVEAAASSHGRTYALEHETVNQLAGGNSI